MWGNLSLLYHVSDYSSDVLVPPIGWCQLYALAALPLGKRPGTHCIGGWVKVPGLKKE
jgi:hypothetical protein